MFDGRWTLGRAHDDANRSGLVILLLTTIALGGCGSSSATGQEGDAGTSEREPFSVDPTCQSTEAMNMEVGEGLLPEDFDPIVEGDSPILYHGPQGGTHLLLAARVANPPPDYPGLLVDFLAEVGNGCTENACETWENVGEYEFDLMPPHPRLTTMPDGSVIGGGFYVIVTRWPDDGVRRVQSKVTDRCGRVGSFEILFAPNTTN